MREVKFRWVGRNRKFNEIAINTDLSTSSLLDRSFQSFFHPSNRGELGNCEFISEDLFTGFKDNKGTEIYEGDILSDWNEVDGKQIQSKMQVFWCEKSGACKLDNSFSQDKGSGDLLSDELHDYAYEITGNIHEVAVCRRENNLSNNRCIHCGSKSGHACGINL